MESNQMSRGEGASIRIRTMSSTFSAESQSIAAEIGKALTMMKDVAVDLERDTQTEMVKKVEDAATKLLELYEDCLNHASAIDSVGRNYQSSEELTDFKKLLDSEFLKLKKSSASLDKKLPFMRQFREAIWNVHHSGQPMPGEEQEDVVMTSSQFTILNVRCPLTGKNVTELEEPVRSVDCRHIYDKQAALHYITSQRYHAEPECPIAGCPKVLHVERVICDPLLKLEIEEMRSMDRSSAPDANIEDFTETDEHGNL